MALALIGGIILIATIVRATKAGAKSAGDIFKYVSESFKQYMNFGGVILVLTVAGLAYYALGFGASDVSYAVLLGTLTTGASVVSTFNTTYVPKTFFYTAATQLTGVKITVQGDGVVFDSDANGLNHCGVSRVAGQVTNSYVFRLSNGFIPGKNVIWEFTNSAAQTPSVYVSSDETAPPNLPLYLQLIRQAILANSGQNFADFATLSFPSIATTDVVNVLYRDGTQQQFNRVDIQADLEFKQNVVNTPVYTIDNYAQTIKLVNVIGGAQTAYVQRWVPAVSGGMINQAVNG